MRLKGPNIDVVWGVLRKLMKRSGLSDPDAYILGVFRENLPKIIVLAAQMPITSGISPKPSEAMRFSAGYTGTVGAFR